ncbi:MAG: glycosyltransferase [Actinobacteria bacterium]|nr:glycosyltransferase [Actinomycetota bacterium]MSX56037.1 glycosyltransferase [Actinomycetota bacterium]MSX92703.1 glycosyltransferase [Actinomycetota bacterium]MSZ82513.1 glycosyltransferase [Actinomycetota bacterium]MTB17727.1 glycosyltransferase [Actinomycetota bacterium]
MRVGMICPYSLSVPGGVQAQVLGLSRQLRRMGMEVRVLGPCDGPPPDTFVTPLGNSLPTASNGSIAPLAPDPACALRTMRVLFDEQFDVLHMHEPFAPGPTMTATLLHPAPIVATFHAAGESASYKYGSAPMRSAAKNIGHRVVVSKDALALVLPAVPGEYETLFNGVELDVYRESVEYHTTGPTIFFCGRHEERKGLDVLLDAMAQMGPEVTLWVASSGPDTERLRARTAADQRIVWLGRISDEEKVARLKGAHVFCAPSLHGESFGVVLIEAMAASTCIVASSLGGYRNVATDDVDSLLVPPGDAAALAAALQRVLADDQLVARLTAAGDRRADDFSMSALAERYAEIYRMLAPTRVYQGPPLSPWLLSPRRTRHTRMMRR